MSIWVALIMFAAGIVLVVKGGDLFVDAASFIAKAAGVPTFIIGATIVSFATTLPEMIVSVIAATEGKNDMAVGNAVGSVTANTGLIMALAFLFMVVLFDRKKYLKQCILLILAGTVLYLGSMSGTLQLWACILLAGVFFAFMLFNVKDAQSEMTESVKMPFEKKTLAKNLILFVIGAAGIVIGSNFLVNGGSEIALFFGVPERVIAITMVAIGTSLPELVTTISAIRKRESQLSVGNIIGANIIDLALILPVCSAISGSGFSVSPQSIAVDLPICLLITLVAIIPMLVRQRAYKAQGLIMLLLYAGYIVFSI